MLDISSFCFNAHTNQSEYIPIISSQQLQSFLRAYHGLRYKFFMLK